MTVMSAASNYTLNPAVHPNAQGWLLVEDYVPCLVATLMYLLFAMVIGPAFMRDRKPFKLRYQMMAHNLLLCIVNAWVFFESGRLLYFKAENWSKCIMPGDLADPYQETRFHYVYYITKYIDWMDTVFFVLRKKDEHISVLHLYHHALMPLGMQQVLRLMPGGHTSMLPFLNSLVHVFMYAYYFLAAFGPKMQPYLKWKRYLTRVQIVQFMVGLIHLSAVILRHRSCPHPPLLVFVMVAQAALFLGMFSHFYVRAYIKVNVKISSHKAISTKME